jgi:hypothetical protein
MGWLNRLKRTSCWHDWECVSFKQTGGHLFFITAAMPARSYVECCKKCGSERSKLMACAADKPVDLTPEIAASCLQAEFGHGTAS